MPPRPRLYIVDGHSYIYRAFYAIRRLSTSKGFPTNSIYGFIQMLLKIVREERPDGLAVVFDPKGPTHREEVFAAYKAHRQPMPDSLVVQVPYIQKVVEAFRIPALTVEGYEADDVIGTLAHRAVGEGYDVTIVTGDKDLLQLVGEHVLVYDTMKEVRYDSEGVRERFGVPPGGVVEILGLMGDASDNIPGVSGVGEKTARELIEAFGTIEGVLSRIEEVSRPRLRDILRAGAESARLSRGLATIETDAPVEIDLGSLARREPDRIALGALFREFEFKSLLKELLGEDGAPEGGGSGFSREAYRAVADPDDVPRLAESLRSRGEFAVDLETTSKDPMRAEIVGIAVCGKEGEAFYLPVGHTAPGSRNLDRRETLRQLAPILADPSVGKVGQNLKYDLLVFSRAGLAVRGVAFDTMVASYLIDPERHSHSLDALAREYLDHETITYADVAGKGAKQVSFDQVPVETATAYAGEDADAALRLTAVLRPKIAEMGMESLYYDVELPLVSVLAEIEENGILLDAGHLREMSKELEREMAGAVHRIHALAGGPFNVNSPKQLAEILFTRLGLPVVKRTKMGPSTDVEVLAQLAVRHDLPAEVLAYRQLAKLKSTYVDTLPALVHPETGRLHTSLNQTVTATGRLSSSEPNLQNIPIRTDLGRRIREAFVAPAGRVLLSADYSQIELRLLAHLSGDPVLSAAFEAGEDVHARTAAEVFGVSPDQVSAEMRRRAKVINFGIIYGMTPYGLSSDLGVTPLEAKAFIDRYFARYPGVRAYIDRTIAEARERGYVTTMLGRRRTLPDIASSNNGVRQAAERTAINTPIQGSAADMIKKAMVELSPALRDAGLSARMILQIHDELLFEVPETEVEEAKSLSVRVMEGALPLSVPVRVDAGVGRNWAEAH
ncbi:MAG: DNA polymerase I [Nitrospirae bacterium RBG_16_64_22]|nr:MAG: DNA polymerase I [Nitrospirae bacterium RBG_16_64_22]